MRQYFNIFSSTHAWKDSSFKWVFGSFQDVFFHIFFLHGSLVLNKFLGLFRSSNNQRYQVDNFFHPSHNEIPFLWTTKNTFPSSSRHSSRNVIFITNLLKFFKVWWSGKKVAWFRNLQTKSIFLYATVENINLLTL